MECSVIYFRFRRLRHLYENGIEDSRSQAEVQEGSNQDNNSAVAASIPDGVIELVLENEDKKNKEKTAASTNTRNSASITAVVRNIELLKIPENRKANGSPGKAIPKPSSKDTGTKTQNVAPNICGKKGKRKSRHRKRKRNNKSNATPKSPDLSPKSSQPGDEQQVIAPAVASKQFNTVRSNSQSGSSTKTAEHPSKSQQVKTPENKRPVKRPDLSKVPLGPPKSQNSPKKFKTPEPKLQRNLRKVAKPQLDPYEIPDLIRFDIKPIRLCLSNKQRSKRRGPSTASNVQKPKQQNRSYKSLLDEPNPPIGKKSKFKPLTPLRLSQPQPEPSRPRSQCDVQDLGQMKRKERLAKLSKFGPTTRNKRQKDSLVPKRQNLQEIATKKVPQPNNQPSSSRVAGSQPGPSSKPASSKKSKPMQAPPSRSCEEVRNIDLACDVD